MTDPWPLAGPAIPIGLEVVEPLAQGPLTAVVHCLEVASGQHVVAKLPAPDTAHPHVAAEALRIEAQIRSTVRHPGVLALTRMDGSALVGPYFPDGALEPYLLTAVPPVLALKLVVQVAAALDAVHAAGWVHGDVNASNILCDWADERFVLADFGAARPVGTSSAARRQLPGRGCPPEALQGGLVHPAEDVFALGRLADACLPAGRPAGVTELLRRTGSPDPRRRPITATAFAVALRQAWLPHAMPSGTPATAAGPLGPDSAPTRPAHPSALGVTALAQRLSVVAAGLSPGERHALRDLLRRAEHATASAATALAAVTVEVFGRAEALAAFEETGLAHALADGPRTAAQAAAHCGLAAEPTRIVLDLLAAQAVVHRIPHGEGSSAASVEYRLAPAIAALYTGDGDRSSRPIGLARTFWADLSHWLYTGTATVPMDGDRTGAGYRDTTSVLGAATVSDARTLASTLAEDEGIASARWIVDVGAGSGVWGRALLPVARHARLALVDRPEALPAAGDPGIEPLVQPVAGDWRALPLRPGSVDVVIMANVCHLEDDDGVARLIEMAARLIRPGGRLLIVDTISSALDQGTLLQSMHLGIRTRRGRVHPGSSYRSWCDLAGLNPLVEHRLSSGLTALVAAA